MIKIKIFIKRLLYLLIFSALSYGYCEGLNRKILNSSNYRKNSNWLEINNFFNELQIRYKIENFKGSKVVTELYCYGKQSNETEILLGGFSKEKGFFNSKGEEFIFDSNLKKGAYYFQNELIGLSVDCIDNPFSLKGMAISSENIIFKTELLCRLSINMKTLTIEEWFPEL